MRGEIWGDQRLSDEEHMERTGSEVMLLRSESLGYPLYDDSGFSLRRAVRRVGRGVSKAAKGSARGIARAAKGSARGAWGSAKGVARAGKIVGKWSASKVASVAAAIAAAGAWPIRKAIRPIFVKAGRMVARKNGRQNPTQNDMRQGVDVTLRAMDRSRNPLLKLGAKILRSTGTGVSGDSDEMGLLPAGIGAAAIAVAAAIGASTALLVLLISKMLGGGGGDQQPQQEQPQGPPQEGSQEEPQEQQQELPPEASEESSGDWGTFSEAFKKGRQAGTALIKSNKDDDSDSEGWQQTWEYRDAWDGHAYRPDETDFSETVDDNSGWQPEETGFDASSLYGDAEERAVEATGDADAGRDFRHRAFEPDIIDRTKSWGEIPDEAPRRNRPVAMPREVAMSRARARRAPLKQGSRLLSLIRSQAASKVVSQALVSKWLQSVSSNAGQRAHLYAKLKAALKRRGAAISKWKSEDAA